MRLIDADAMLEAYDAEHDGPPGRTRKLIEDAPTIQVAGIWKPFHFRELTEEEHLEHPLCDRMYTSEMPGDGADTLVTTKHGTVGKTLFDEEYCDFDDYHIEDLIAWAEPIPYKGTVNEPD